jgi:hypothetical protein
MSNPSINEVPQPPAAWQALLVFVGYVLSDRCAAKRIRVKKATEPATRLVRAVETELTGQSTL